MQNNYYHLLGSEKSLTSLEAIRLVEGAVCEGFESFTSASSAQETNIFGRKLSSSSNGNPAYVCGMGVTGLRTAALLKAKEAVSSFEHIQGTARQHVPMVFHIAPDGPRNGGFSKGAENQLRVLANNSACFHLVSSNVQEALDFSIIAHRIAELSLIPGIHSIANSSNDEKILIPSASQIIEYLGNPDEHVSEMTPAQKIIFGKGRRRVPNWYSADTPAALSISKDADSIALETGANSFFFHAHLKECILQAFAEFKKLTNRSYAPVQVSGSSSSSCFVSFGTTASLVNESMSNETGNLKLTLLNPLPSKQIEYQLSNVNAITILEPVSLGIAKFPALFGRVVGAMPSISGKAISAQTNASLSKADIQLAEENMKSSSPKRRYILGMDYSHAETSYPKHQVLLQHINREYPDANKESLNANEDKTENNAFNVGVPASIREFKDNGAAWTKLSRFNDDTALFYQNGDKAELVADPFQALALMPAASASFNNAVNERTMIPVFDPSKSDGQGSAFVNCPHSAIPPVVLGMEAVLKAGMAIASKRGVIMSKLTPVIKNLGKTLAKYLKESDNDINLGELIQESFKALAEKMGVSGDKLEGMQAEIDEVCISVAALPVALTDTFFHSREVQEKGSGEIFSLALDPHSCTGCGVCAKSCSDGSIQMEEQTSENLEKAVELFKLWEQLPDTDGETIKRLYEDDSYDSFAAIMLSRAYQMSMVGSGGNSDADAAKAMLHRATAIAEAVVQPGVIEQIKNIKSLIDALSTNVHKMLSDTLPKENFDSLEDVLSSSNGRKERFDNIINKLGETEHLKMVDTVSLKRKLELISSLKDLQWTLTEGPTGVGRSRYGMLLSGSLGEQLAQYPFNSFTVPTMHWDSDAPAMSLGLFQGQMRYILDNIKLMRRAELESKNKYDADIHDAEIANLDWNNLSDDEKAIVNPMLVFADNAALSSASESGLNSILASNYPMKVIVIDNGIIEPNENAQAIASARFGTLLSAAALQNASLVQGSSANPKQLFNGMMKAINTNGPALIRIFAPDVKGHFIAPDAWYSLAPMALNSRMHPAFEFTANDESSYISSSFKLENPSDDSDWHSQELSYSEGEEEKTMNYKVTWADWAYTLKSWKSHFEKYEGDATCSVADYLALDANGRKSKTAVITRISSGEIQHYSVSDLVISVSESILNNWRSLQEIAGVLVEFPEKLRNEVEDEAAAKLEKELAQAKADYEQKLQEQEQVQADAIRRKLRDKLVSLAKQAKTN